MTTHREWICLLFLTTLAWGQAATPAAPPAPHKAATASRAAGKTAGGVTVAPSTAVITIPGVCDKPGADKSKAANCKTVVTRAEFEQLIAAVAPTIAPPNTKQLATQYGMALVMVHKAHERGLDQGPKFQQLMKVARIEVLTKELSQRLQEETGKISDKEVETYYHNNEAAFQEIGLQRIFIPLSKQPAETKDAPAGDAAKKEQQASEDAMKKLADELRARAAAGEDFQKLQDEAVAASGFKGKPPVKLGKVRRSSLPPEQGGVFDLKPGETSQVISNPNGYLVYKAGEKDTVPLDTARGEIFATLQSQRMQDAVEAIQHSATPELNEKYFGDATADSRQGNTPGGAPAQPVESPESGPK